MGEYDYLKGFWYGVPGSRKTRLGYSGACRPETSPVLGFNLHGNPISIRDYPQDQIHIINLERLKIVEIENVLGSAFEFLESGKQDNLTKTHLPNLKTKPKVIVFDSLTDLNRRAAFKLSDIDDLKFGHIPTVEVNQIKDYNLLHSYLHSFAEALYSLPIHTVVTALEATEEKQGIVLPALTGKAAKELVAYPYLVGRLTVWARVDETVRAGMLKSGMGLLTPEGEVIESKKNNEMGDIQSVLQIRPSMKVPIAKNQYNSDPTNYIVNPDFGTLLKFLNLA